MNLDAFLEIENKYGLVQDKIDGFAYWTYFRSNLQREALKIKGSGSGVKLDASPTRSKWKQTLARIGTIKYALLFSKIPKGKHDVLILNVERRVWTGSCYECIYTDRIAKAYPGSIVLERPYTQKHFRPVETKNLVYTDAVEIKTMAYWYFQNFTHKDRIANIRKILYNKIRKPVEDICNAYQAECNTDYILDKMVCGYFVYQIKKKEFGKILDKIQPEIILEMTGYSMDCMIINELALERHIPTVELQHGSTGPEHIAYNYYPGTRVEQFSRYFFAFSKFWLEAAAARYPLTSDRLKEVGFPYLDAKAENVRKRISRSVPCKIIFISQITIGRVLSETAVSLRKLIDADRYRIVFKLHPFEYEKWREWYPGLADSDIEVIDNNRVDLYELFAASTYQVGGYSSTAVFEGLQFDLKTYIMREGAYPEVRLLCENGLAQFFDSAQDLYEKILEETETTGAKISFWKENALENIKREVDAIINRSSQ